MKYYGNIQVKGDKSIITLNSNPNQENPYSGWVTYDTVGESVFAGAALYLNLTTQKWYKSIANNVNTLPCRGLALSDQLAGQECPILRFGIVYMGRWNFLQSSLYISDSSLGSLTHTIPTSVGSYVQCVGNAKARRIAMLDFTPTLIQIG